MDNERRKWTIRAARCSDASVLSSLALRSKAYWNYDAAFMRSVAPLLDFSEVAIELAEIYLLEDDEATLGFYRLSMYGFDPFLDDLWVDPPHIGRGVGKRLWMHALEGARRLNWGHFMIESDPNAEGFYRHMGARRVGERQSPTGRMLPLLRVDVAKVANT